MKMPGRWPVAAAKRCRVAYRSGEAKGGALDGATCATNQPTSVTVPNFGKGGIERWSPKPKVAGSTPAGRTTACQPRTMRLPRRFEQANDRELSLYIIRRYIML